MITGIASTPELDRAGDILDPAGATFRIRSRCCSITTRSSPIGTATLTARAEGIAFEATLPTVDEPGPLKTRVDDAWQCIKAGVISGVSIGYRILQGGVEQLKSGARRITKIGNLRTVARHDSRERQRHDPAREVTRGPAPPTEKPVMKQTISEHIQNLENKRAALAATMTEIMESAAGEGKTLEADAGRRSTTAWRCR